MRIKTLEVREIFVYKSHGQVSKEPFTETLNKALEQLNIESMDLVDIKYTTVFDTEGRNHISSALIIYKELEE